MTTPLRGVIGRFATGTYTVTRYAADTDDGHGNNVRGAVASTFTTRALIVPTSGRDLKVLELYQMTEETRTMYTVDDVRVTDTVAIDGETWAVFRSTTWDAFGGKHRIAYLARQVVGR
jgi:hypothetical protein